MIKQKVRSTGTLMNALHFDTEDLEINQRGYLSRPQMIQLNMARVWWGFIIAFVVSVPMPGFFVVTLWIASNVGGAIHDAAVIIATVFWVVCWAAPMYAGGIWSQYNQDIRSGAVECLIGDVRLGEYATEGKIKIYYLYYAWIDDFEFRISRAAYYAFVQGETYTVYFAPRSMTLLSAELLYESDQTETQSQVARLRV